MHAEYDEVLVSGAMRGKQHTYAAFDERVPPGPDYDEDGRWPSWSGGTSPPAPR